MDRPNVLLIVEECNPEGMSSPRIGFELFDAIRREADVTLVTRERFRPNLERAGIVSGVDYLPMGPIAARYFSLLTRHLYPRLTNWGIRHALSYPLYSQFNRAVFERYEERAMAGEFDIVHAITPMIPRYPYKISKACHKTPFFLGPVNGGLPCPPQFQKEMRSEFAFSDLLRSLSTRLPGYRETYTRASKVFVGSGETRRILCEAFPDLNARCATLAENGIPIDLLQPLPASSKSDCCQLLWTGRLTPVKGLDLLLESLAFIHKNWHLTLVGEGSERARLESLAASLGVASKVTFTGWISSEEISSYYCKSDLFCFPSIRESGGAAVLEAMAHGLPVVAFDYGGYTEYLDDQCARLVPLSTPEEMTRALSREVATLVENPDLRHRMGTRALARAEHFTWQAKGTYIVDAYKKAITEKQPVIYSSN